MRSSSRERRGARWCWRAGADAFGWLLSPGLCAVQQSCERDCMIKEDSDPAPSTPAAARTSPGREMPARWANTCAALPGTAHGPCEDYRAAAGIDLFSGSWSSRCASTTNRSFKGRQGRRRSPLPEGRLVGAFCVRYLRNRLHDQYNRNTCRKSYSTCLQVLHRPRNHVNSPLSGLPWRRRNSAPSVRRLSSVHRNDQREDDVLCRMPNPQSVATAELIRQEI